MLYFDWRASLCKSSQNIAPHSTALQRNVQRRTVRYIGSSEAFCIVQSFDRIALLSSYHVRFRHSFNDDASRGPCHPSSSLFEAGFIHIHIHIIIMIVIH